jgi:hypothetical protein
MSFNLDDVNVGGQLKVGSGVVPAVGEGDKRVNGSVYAEGPVQIGDQGAFGSNTATLMVGRTTNSDADCNPAALSVNVKGCQQIDGDSGMANGLLVSGGSSVNSLYVVGDLFVSGSIDGGNKGRLASRFAAADASPKPFDIKHPSKVGWRLRYACIEGPEVGVYHRGRVRNEKIIRLPEYWKDLVHIDSISVQLQPIGAHQNIIVKRWDDQFIYLQGQGLPIDCFYHVYAARKDVNPLYVEYEGESWKDYPDPNFNPDTAPDTPNYNDPEYRTKRNTITI